MTNDEKMMDLIETIMNTNKIFDAKILAVENCPKGRFLRFYNMNAGTEGRVPEVSIINYVELPSNVVDAEGHILKDAIIKLREKEPGIYYPDCRYPKKANSIARTIAAKKMNKETLYEDAQLYQVMTLSELWKQFVYGCTQRQIAEDAMLTAINMKGVASESEQYDYLCKILNIDTVDIGMQENRDREYKSSFLHCANPLRSERSSQAQAIFKEIVAFGNSRIEGNVFVGIANDGKLFCRIHVPKWEGNLLLMNGCELYVRENAGKRQLKNADMINYIISYISRKEVA